MLRIYDTGNARESRSGQPTYFQQSNPSTDPDDDMWEQVATRLLQRTPALAGGHATPVPAGPAPPLLGVLRLAARYWLFGIRSDQRDGFGRGGRFVIAICACQSLAEATASDAINPVLDFVGSVSQIGASPQDLRSIRELNYQVFRENASLLDEGTRATWTPDDRAVRFDSDHGSPADHHPHERPREPARRTTHGRHRHPPIRMARWQRIRDLATPLALLTSIAVNGILAMQLAVQARATVEPKQIAGQAFETVELKDGQLAKVIILKRWKPRTDSGDGDPGLGGQDKAQQPSQRGPTSTSLDDNSSKPNERQEGAVDQSTLR
jgi:hypothetical protein